jgi:hypothetical protein
MNSIEEESVFTFVQEIIRKRFKHIKSKNINIMKKVTALIGTGLLTVILLSFVGKGNCQGDDQVTKAQTSLENHYWNYSHDPYLVLDADSDILENIVYLEENEEIDLGFDTADYLPTGFNPYEGMEFDIDKIDYIELEEEPVLGFDTNEYLPIGFDPYVQLELNLDEIVYIEDEEDILLDFDTQMYLPEGFDAYAEVEINLDEIAFIEDEEEIVLGFDPQKYLPKGFDAYSK